MNTPFLTHSIQQASTHTVFLDLPMSLPVPGTGRNAAFSGRAILMIGLRVDISSLRECILAYGGNK